MKKYLIPFLLLFCTLIGTAQEHKSFDTSDWKRIKDLCTSRPDSIQNLVKTLTSRAPKSPLTTEESLLAYIGQSYISQGKEEKILQEMFKALIISGFKIILKIQLVENKEVTLLVELNW